MANDLIGEVFQKGQARSNRNQCACMTRCMNVDEASTSSTFIGLFIWSM